MSIRHFLTLLDYSGKELLQILDLACELKKRPHQFKHCQDQTLALVFEKPSTRTRVSFEVGMKQLGGEVTILESGTSQMGRGEPVEDSARVLSSMVDLVMMRTFEHERLETFAGYSKVPVINGLSDSHHPCQVLTDIFTYIEHRGSIAGKTISWIGDANNMCSSYIHAAKQFNFTLHISSPQGFEPNRNFLKEYQQHAVFFESPQDAVENAHMVVTDVWTSMGQEDDQEARNRSFSGFQVNHELLAKANENVVFMHCLPAHRGEEVSSILIEDNNYSLVWHEAENRLHVQKALMLALLGKARDD